MVFLNSLFGYLCCLIIQKWVTGSQVDLYHVLIYMFLKPGQIDESGYAFPGQGGLQNFLLVLAFASVPWMLLPKPLVLRARHEKAMRRSSAGGGGAYAHIEDDREAVHGDAHAHGHGEHEFEFGEVRGVGASGLRGRLGG